MKGHCFGQRKKGVKFDALSEEEKLKLRHYSALKILATKLTEMNVLEKAVEKHKEYVWMLSYEERASGSSLPAVVQATRVKVLEDLWGLGIPVTKLRDKRLVSLIEDAHHDTGGEHGIVDACTIAVEHLLESARKAVKGRPIAIIFDTSNVNMLIEAILGRFLNDDDMPTTICIGVAEVPRSVNAESQQTLLRYHIGVVEIAMSDIVGAISDSGPPNPTCMTNWNAKASETFFGEQLRHEQLLWEPCLMHGMSNCGVVIRKRLPLLKLFMSGYKTMFQLEGDWFCLPFVQQHISLINAMLALWKQNRTGHPVIHEICAKATASRMDRGAVDQLPNKFVAVADALVSQFERAILTDMRSWLPIWSAAGLFNPRRFVAEASKEGFEQVVSQAFDTLLALKGISLPEALRVSLLGE